MASGFFGVTGPRHFELGVEGGADNGGEGVGVDVQVVSLLNPLAHCLMGGKASGLPGNLLQRGQYVWREGQGLAGRHVHLQQGRHAARVVAREPVAAGMAVDPQELGHVPACRGLPVGQPIEHLEPWLLAPVMFTS
jgi:hypothetical protein